MKSLFGQNLTTFDKEEIDIVTKWLLIINGGIGIFFSLIVYIYPAGNPPSMLLLLLSLSLIWKGKGNYRCFEMPWKTYCWTYTVFMILLPVITFILVEKMLSKLTFVWAVEYSIGLIGAVGIYGFVFKKKFFNQTFWKMVFIVYIADDIWRYIEKWSSPDFS